MGRFISCLGAALLVASCGSGDSYNEEEEYLADEEYSDVADYEGEEVGGETYEEYDERRDSLDGAYGTFEGDGCTVDCSGHEAGYSWAEENGITDPDDCGGNSWSFEEGCRAFAEEQSY